MRSDGRSTKHGLCDHPRHRSPTKVRASGHARRGTAQRFLRSEGGAAPGGPASKLRRRPFATSRRIDWTPLSRLGAAGTYPGSRRPRWTAKAPAALRRRLRADGSSRAWGRRAEPSDCALPPRGRRRVRARRQRGKIALPAAGEERKGGRTVHRRLHRAQGGAIGGSPLRPRLEPHLAASRSRRRYPTSSEGARRPARESSRAVPSMSASVWGYEPRSIRQQDLIGALRGDLRTAPGYPACPDPAERPSCRHAGGHPADIE